VILKEISRWEITKQKTGIKKKGCERFQQEQRQTNWWDSRQKEKAGGFGALRERERGRRWFRKRSAQGMSKRQPVVSAVESAVQITPVLGAGGR
jgi:hypothetical protein